MRERIYRWVGEGPGREPERPWENAQPGEVWLITFNGVEMNAVADDKSMFHAAEVMWLLADSEQITAGRKLLNADGSYAGE